MLCKRDQFRVVALAAVGLAVCLLGAAEYPRARGPASGPRNATVERKVSEGGLAAGPTGNAAGAPARHTVTPPPGAAWPFTVAAAADLRFAFTEIGQLFEARTGQKVVFSFGSTGNLARQIENGAPFDLFAAANIAFVDRLHKKGLLVPDTRQLYAVGRIVLACSRKSGVTVRALKGLADPRIKKVAIANPEHAPYGHAAREALRKAGVWRAVQPKLVLGEDVRQALQFVQTGNAEAGIVALSVARVPEITWTLIDERLHAPLRQALAVLKRSPHEQTARRFAAFVNGPEGRPVMRKYGFVLPTEL